MPGDEENANTCVVCFKEALIFSVGECDHPVCFECSTRMRVLCQQTECPICRQDMPKVAFSEEIRPFKKQQQKLFDRKYKIAFTNASVEEAFKKLLQHCCKLCTDRPEYRTFNALKDHMRKEHELFYCDLCVANLKIFSSERRCYTRQELAQHRRKGDPDDRSHRGHPLCEFCDQRFVDSDELFRHLRRIHLYCHFCDADGYHRYFGSYDYLREHFRTDHFLCEEGECKEEKFTSVFRSDIDLKAHRASVHGRALGKAATKQARTLELEFTLAPRPRGPGAQGHGHRRGHNTDEVDGAVGYTEPALEVAPARPNLQEDFPSLSGSTAPAPAASGHIQFKGRGGRLNMSEEHFPALSGGEQGSNVNISLQRGGAQRPTSNNNFSIKVQHKRRQETMAAPVSSAPPPNRGLSDFPSLGAPQKAPVASSWKGKVTPKGNVVGKVLPQPVGFSQPQPPTFNHVPPQSSSSSLAGRPVSDGKSKVTVKPPSVVTPIETEESKSASKSSKKKKNKARQNSTSPLPQTPAVAAPATNGPSSSGAKSKRSEDRKCSELKIGALQEDSTPSPPISSTAFSSTSFGPPPGFSGNSSNRVQSPVSPPPGFSVSSVTLNSVARPTNGLTFTNSCGESFPIRQTPGVFIQPTDSKERNSSLVQRIQSLQRDKNEGFSKFCQMSSKFRRGDISAVDYYNHCRESVGEKAFANVFPEILVLLPDIHKQQELWLAHGRKGDFSECVKCGQVLSSFDKRAHDQNHVMNNNFPSLTPSANAPKPPKWTVTRK